MSYAILLKRKFVLFLSIITASYDYSGGMKHLVLFFFSHIFQACFSVYLTEIIICFLARPQMKSTGLNRFRIAGWAVEWKCGLCIFDFTTTYGCVSSDF